MGRERLALVGCGSKKVDERTATYRLYDSNYFYRKFTTASFIGTPAIASAKHGLLWPHEVIDPYERTLSELTDEDRTAWAEQLCADIPDRYDEVWLLMGRTYAEPIIDVCSVPIVDPFKDTNGIHEQHDFMNDVIAEHTSG